MGQDDGRVLEDPNDHTKPRRQDALTQSSRHSFTCLYQRDSTSTMCKLLVAVEFWCGDGLCQGVLWEVL